MSDDGVEAIRRELASLVRDPAVNRAIGDLGIIRDVQVSEGRLRVRLRPCTPDCWPLAMAGIARSIRRYADARGLTADVEVEPVMLIPPDSLETMVADVETNPGRLRAMWERSFTVSLAGVLAALEARGFTEDEIAGLDAADLARHVASGFLPAEAVGAYLHWRHELGFPEHGSLLTDATGQPISDARRWQRRARLALVSQRTYAAICRDTADAFHPQPPASDGEVASHNGR